MTEFLKKIFLYSFLFSLVIIVYSKFYELKIYEKKEEFVKFIKYKNENNIVLGSSHSKDITPYGFYNFGSGSQTLDLSLIVLNDLLQKSKIDTILLVISPFHFQHIQKKNSEFYIKNNYPQYKVNIIERFLFDIEKKSRIIELFQNKKTFSINKPTQKDFLLRRHHIGDGLFAGKIFFDEIVNQSIKNNIELIVLIPPYLDGYLEVINKKKYFESSIKYIENRQKEGAVRFIDLRNFFKEKKKPYSFFKDADHLTKKSGEIVSKHIDSLFKTISLN
jgi:hypothetical protein